MRHPAPVLLALSLAACAHQPTGRSSDSSPAACPEAPAAAAPATAPPSAAPPAAPKKFSMRTYYMGFLKRGPAWSDEDTPERRAASEGHMAHIREMGAAGKLIFAGPFNQGPDAPKDALAGIYLFDVATMEEARALTAADPAVKAGRFTMDILEWYGPAGLTYDGDERASRDAPKAAQ